MTTELWKDIPEYPKYQASNLGNIRNRSTEYVLKPYLTNRGYHTVGFTVNGKKKRESIHRLVAFAFLPNPDNLPEVNHINGIKTDNRLSNLEWSSRGHNTIHAYQNGLQKTKLSKEQVIQIRNYHEQGLTLREIASMFDVSFVTIGEICRGLIWQHI